MSAGQGHSKIESPQFGEGAVDFEGMFSEGGGDIRSLERSQDVQGHVADRRQRLGSGAAAE